MSVDAAPPPKPATVAPSSRSSVRQRTGVASAEPSSSSAMPVRGNRIFHQLKAEVLRGDPSAAFPTTPPPSLDSISLRDRLLSLAQTYLDPEAQDFPSASIYSFLALLVAPTSVDARRIRAQTLLLAGQGAVFPFLAERSLKAGAAAALATLQEGPDEVFADEECARIWSKCCEVLDRKQEAEDALTWCLHAHATSEKSGRSMKRRLEKLPELLPLSDRRDALVLVHLARMAKENRNFDQAENLLLQARRKDPWSWSAWTGLCELGSTHSVSMAFPDAMVQHQPAQFLDFATIALGGTPLGPDYTNEPTDSRLVRTEQEAAVPEKDPTLSHPRPGSRTVVPARAGTAPVTAKRTRGASNSAVSGAGRAPTAGRTAAAFGIENAATRTGPATASGRGATWMTRTLSQAKTNERPPSSLSNSSSGKEKQSTQESLTVTKDSLRRSTRAQTGVTTTTAMGTTATAATATATPVQSVPRTANKGVTSNAALRTTDGPVNHARSKGSVDQRPGSRTTTSRLQAGKKTPNSDKAPSESGSVSAGAATHSDRTALAGLPQNKPTNPRTKASEPAVVDEVAHSIRQATLRKAAEEAMKWRTVDCEILRYLRLLGEAYKDTLAFRGDKILRLFSARTDCGLGKEAMNALLDTPEVGVLVARIHHDMAQYPEAEQCFKAAMRGRAHIVESMDIYSLVLFHLHRHEELSALAQQLLSIDANAVETHLAVGNLFSLSSSPSIALRSFRRACLAAPSYAYSFTLAGHECLSLNQPLRALRFFRQAVRVDRRHWNGWSGVGTILSTEGKWAEAKVALSQACQLNGSNSGLYEVLAVVQEMVGDKSAALESYNQAVLLNPRSASATLRKAELLWSMNRLEAAHSALLQAISLNNNDARAHLLLAESYMRKGGGCFAPLSSANKRTTGGGGSSTGGLDVKAKAVGEPRPPSRYQAEIARHLAIAVDLEPMLSRRVRAMAEGIGATLRGQSHHTSASHASRGQVVATTHLTAGQSGFLDRSIGSSFSGIDESRRPYDGEEGEEFSYSQSENPALLLDDSMGVLRDRDDMEAEQEESSEGVGGEDDGDSQQSVEEDDREEDYEYSEPRLVGGAAEDVAMDDQADDSAESGGTALERRLPERSDGDGEGDSGEAEMSLET